MVDNLQSLAPEPAAPRSDYAVQGRVPEWVLQPTDREQAAAVLAAAHAHRRAVVPWGGGTQQDFGYPPERIDLVLDLSQLRRIVEYEPADLTVTVEAGCTLAELQAVLAEHQQTLPLDPPRPEQATIGGLLATNTNGPLRYGHGAWRDRLLGLRMLRADGTLIKSGGKVVKNVAGLDLGKLFIGSLGTLGVLIEATFKLHPQPVTERLLHLALPSPAAAEEVLAALMETPLLPSLMELRGGGQRGRAEERGEWELFIGFAGPEETVAWEVDELRRLLAGLEVAEVEPETQADPLVIRHPSPVTGLHGPSPTSATLGASAHFKHSSTRRELADFPAAVAPTSGRVSLRATMLSSAVAGFCQTVLEQADGLGVEVSLQASVGNGIVHVHLDWDESASRAPQVEMVQQLCGAAVTGRGNLLVTAAPPDLKPELPVWGASRDDFVLMQRVKEQMDPNRLLNPGRFVGRL